MYNLNKTIMRKRFTLALLSLLLVPLGMMAQSVTVEPTTGKLIAAKTGGSEAGFARGWSSMWRHEQLPLTLTVSDAENLNAGGEVAVPAGNISLYNSQLVLAGGPDPDCYFVLSLPKGYRITGYRLVLLNNLNGKNVNSLSVGSTTKIVYETDNKYNIDAPKATGEFYANNEATGENEMGGEDDSRDYVIARNSMNKDDMGNQLYFRIHHGDYAYYAVRIKSFEVLFTAEGAFDAEVVPVEVGQASSYVSAPFTASKTDIGAITRNPTGTYGQYYYSYDYLNVQDYAASMAVYQKDAVSDGKPADVGNKNITPVKVDDQNLYAFGNDTYYVESPIAVLGQSGTAIPVGYRITSARFNYLWGSKTSSSSKTMNACYITGSNRYSNNAYLSDNLEFTTTRTEWQIDEKGNIYRMNNGKKRIISCYGSGDHRYLTYSSDEDARWNLRRSSDGRIYYESDSHNFYYLQYITYNRYEGYREYAPGVVKQSSDYYYSNYRANSEIHNGITINYPAFNPGAYTINVYDKTGKNVVFTKKVNGASDVDAEGYELDSLNNDAVKFSITGLEDGKQALVKVTLSLEQLNPYIDNMNIVCHDPTNTLELSIPFTAENFRVSGGKFTFYIPEEYKEKDLTFTFDDLYSKSGDKTYYTDNASLKKDGNARYSFVTSEYFEAVDGKGDGGLYDNNYDPDASYTKKIVTSTAGNIRFKFNNAENLSNTGGQSGTSYLEETPFSVSAYIGSKDPDNSTETGKFDVMKLNASGKNGLSKSDTYYVFVADETRYNIAPTTAWQHRWYAFYRMDIDLEAKTYQPDFKWEKVYDKTCFNKNGQATTDPMWGLTLGTKDGNTKVDGYLTVKEISDAIDAAMEKEGCPANKNQILYVDGSELVSILSSAGKTLQQLKNDLAPNCLFYLPKGTTSTLLLSKDKYGKAKNASVIMPYELEVDGNGVHTNADGTTLTIHTMQTSNALKLKDNSTYAYFPAWTAATKTEANTPYFVEVTENSSENGVSFVVSQEGTIIEASKKNGIYTGESSTGEVDGTITGNVTFTPTGSFSGVSLAKSSNSFYFANNEFVNSADYSYDADIKIGPFRAYYATSGGTVKNLHTLNVVFGENMGGSDGIKAVENGAQVIDINAPVYDLQGRKLADSIVGATLKRGIYVINGVKFTVK